VGRRVSVDQVVDIDTKGALREALDHQLGSIDLTGLSEAGRREALQALREDLIPAVESKWPDQALTRGHVKILALMARDV
jgi:hypothetical protein